jgi:hypothetical protein
MKEILYSKPTPEEVLEAAEFGGYFKEIFHNNILNHYKFTVKPYEKKPCKFCPKKPSDI